MGIVVVVVFICNRKPHQYLNLKLPHKLPPKREPMAVNSLPMLGYLEQTVAVAITKAMTAVGNVKPKYPFLSASKSALIYVAFHLKGRRVLMQCATVWGCLMVATLCSELIYLSNFIHHEVIAKNKQTKTIYNKHQMCSRYAGLASSHSYVFIAHKINCK